MTPQRAVGYALFIAAVLTTVACWGAAIYLRWIVVESPNSDAEGMALFMIALSAFPAGLALLIRAILRSSRPRPE